MDPVAIKPAPGCRLVLPEGGMTLDNVGIAPGSDMPADGAYVQPGVWLRKRLDEGDAVPVSQAAIDAAARVPAGAERGRDKQLKTDGSSA